MTLKTCAQVSMYSTLLFSVTCKVYTISQAKIKPYIFLALILLVEMKSYTNLELVFTLLPFTPNYFLIFFTNSLRPYISLNNTPAFQGSKELKTTGKMHIENSPWRQGWKVNTKQQSIFLHLTCGNTLPSRELGSDLCLVLRLDVTVYSV